MEQIDSATDALNEALEAAEDQLAAMFSVPSAIRFDERRQLHFGKMGGVWRVFLESADGQRVLGTSVSRMDRIAIADRLPELLSALRAEARVTLSAVNAAVEKIRSFTSDLRGAR